MENLKDITRIMWSKLTSLVSYSADMQSKATVPKHSWNGTEIALRPIMKIPLQDAWILAGTCALPRRIRRAWRRCRPIMPKLWVWIPSVAVKVLVKSRKQARLYKGISHKFSWPAYIVLQALETCWSSPKGLKFCWPEGQGQGSSLTSSAPVLIQLNSSLLKLAMPHKGLHMSGWGKKD